MFYTTTSSNIIGQQVEAEEREVMSVESPIQSKQNHPQDILKRFIFVMWQGMRVRKPYIKKVDKKYA